MVATIEYLAGFFDGEGWIGVSADTHRQAALRCAATNLNLEVLERFRTAFGGRISQARVRRPDGRLHPWVWQIGGAAAKEFLAKIERALIVKRPQAIEALRFPLCLAGQRVTPEMNALRLQISRRLRSLKEEVLTSNPRASAREKAEANVEDVPRAVELYLTGKTIGQVATEVQQSYATVSRWLGKVGVRRSREAAMRLAGKRKGEQLAGRPEVKEAARLYESGMSAAAVAKKMGHEPATVNYWLRTLGKIRPLTAAQRLRRSREGKRST